MKKNTGNTCKCGVELFDCDIVRREWDIGNELTRTYRCPKCFIIKEVVV